MRSVLDIILLVLQIYIWLLIAAAVLSWLIAFSVVNTRNQLVATIGDFLYRLTEPVLRPVRRVIPPAGMFDVSFMVVFFALFFLQSILRAS